MLPKFFVVLVLIFVLAISLTAQNVHWKPKKKKIQKVELFHSTQSVHFATATFLRKGEFEYEISHRFLPTINTQKAFLGIDGPARIRMGLAYGITEKTMIMLARSNAQDNIDLHFKHHLLAWANNVAPLKIAARIGMGWNTEVVGRKITDGKNFQYYGQLIFNTMIRKKLALGVVPSYLYNSHIFCQQNTYSFTFGAYFQYYLGAMWSLLIETNTTITGYRGQFNSALVGIELETGGHFFKIFVGNNATPNPSQYLAGSDLKMNLNNLRLGFNITRILKF